MTGKCAFVTVGTTEFDQLIQSATSSDVCKALRQLGYTQLLLQIGRGQFEPEATELSDHSPAVHFYRFKDSIADDIKAANLVICHAGAGSVLETLGAGKAAVVVINDQLMDNHQVELARQLQRLGHLYYCTCRTLHKTLEEADFTSLQPFTPGTPTLFTSHLDSLLTGPPGTGATLVFLFHLSWIGMLAVLYMLTPTVALLLLLTVSCLAVFVFWGEPKKVQ
ncbi:UDP-N-acetylglucosamine transferase subunit ALG13-like [Littorina saxatilis]|uniref:UDP-N-acetylglucosamine transferase subunit ALG13 n=1 Tax=Littorina saxatilis TaxID=31220 RepID=A0AAN9B0B7_9CAEN